MSSWTWWDIMGCLRAVVAFVPVLVAPGFCIAWIADLCGFRQRHFVKRIAWCLPVSLAFMGIFAVDVTKYVSLRAVCWFCALCVLGMIALTMRSSPAQRNSSVRSGSLWIIGAGWTVFVIVELLDIGVGHRLLLSVTMYDHSLRTAFVDSVMRTGVPPANPLFWPGHAVAIHYYYFWYVLTAVAAVLGHTTARQAIIASGVWSGFALAAVLYLYLREFLPANLDDGIAHRRWPRFYIALALMLVTGLDVLPAIAKGIFGLPMDPDMEWWSFDQVSSWLDSFLWVPHHIAALVCCLFAFLLVWVSKGGSWRERNTCAMLSAFAFASAVGLSIYVALAFAFLMAAWIIWVLLREPASRTRVMVLVPGAIAASLLLIPFLRELLSDGGQTGGSPLQGYIRHMIDPTLVLDLPVLRPFADHHPRIAEVIVSLALLVPGYCLEFGFYVLVLVFALRAAARFQLSDADRSALFLCGMGVLISTFVRSTAITNNDFGYRSVLIAQFFLLLLAVRWCEAVFGTPGTRIRVLSRVLIGIGIAGSVYQAAELRLYLPAQAWLGRPVAAGLSARAWAWRHAYEQLHTAIPASAVVQYSLNPPSEYFAAAQLLDIGRQTAAGLPGCGTPFGGPAQDCPEIEAAIAGLFSGTDSAESARATCRRLGVNYLIASRWDAAWAHPTSWVWTLPSAVVTDSARVVHCQ